MKPAPTLAAMENHAESIQLSPACCFTIAMVMEYEGPTPMARPPVANNTATAFVGRAAPNRVAIAAINDPTMTNAEELGLNNQQHRGAMTRRLIANNAQKTVVMRDAVSRLCPIWRRHVVSHTPHATSAPIAGIARHTQAILKHVGLLLSRLLPTFKLKNEASLGGGSNVNTSAESNPMPAANTKLAAGIWIMLAK